MQNPELLRHLRQTLNESTVERIAGLDNMLVIDLSNHDRITITAESNYDECWLEIECRSFKDAELNARLEWIEDNE